MIPLSAMELSSVTQLSPPEAKIALFRSLFRGRIDVYPRRFENRKTGKAGYAPACERMGSRNLREASNQVRRMSEPPLSSYHR